VVIAWFLVAESLGVSIGRVATGETSRAPDGGLAAGHRATDYTEL